MGVPAGELTDVLVAQVSGSIVLVSQPGDLRVVDGEWSVVLLDGGA